MILAVNYCYCRGTYWLPSTNTVSAMLITMLMLLLIQLRGLAVATWKLRTTKAATVRYTKASHLCQQFTSIVRLAPASLHRRRRAMMTAGMSHSVTTSSDYIQHPSNDYICHPSYDYIGHCVFLSVSVLTAIFPGEHGLVGFIRAKDDGDGWDTGIRRLTRGLAILPKVTRSLL